MTKRAKYIKDMQIIYKKQYFYLLLYFRGRNSCIHEKIDFQFLMDLYVLESFVYNFPFFEKKMSVYEFASLYVCDSIFVCTLSKEVMQGNWWAYTEPSC